MFVDHVDGASAVNIKFYCKKRVIDRYLVSKNSRIINSRITTNTHLEEVMHHLDDVDYPFELVFMYEYESPKNRNNTSIKWNGYEIYKK